jgi:hypothetical protein
MAVMDHYLGMPYELEEVTSPAGWRWVVRLDDDSLRTGFPSSQAGALLAAMKTIDDAAALQK